MQLNCGGDLGKLTHRARSVFGVTRLNFCCLVSAEGCGVLFGEWLLHASHAGQVWSGGLVQVRLVAVLIIFLSSRKKSSKQRNNLRWKFVNYVGARSYLYRIALIPLKWCRIRRCVYLVLTSYRVIYARRDRHSVSSHFQKRRRIENTTRSEVSDELWGVRNLEKTLS